MYLADDTKLDLYTYPSIQISMYLSSQTRGFIHLSVYPHNHISIHSDERASLCSVIPPFLSQLRPSSLVISDSSQQGHRSLPRYLNQERFSSQSRNRSKSGTLVISVAKKISQKRWSFQSRKRRKSETWVIKKSEK